jgi:hypothetical protein
VQINARKSKEKSLHFGGTGSGPPLGIWLDCGGTRAARVLWSLEDNLLIIRIILYTFYHNGIKLLITSINVPACGDSKDAPVAFFGLETCSSEAD